MEIKNHVNKNLSGFLDFLKTIPQQKPTVGIKYFDEESKRKLVGEFSVGKTIDGIVNLKCGEIQLTELLYWRDFVSKINVKEYNKLKLIYISGISSPMNNEIDLNSYYIVQFEFEI